MSYIKGHKETPVILNMWNPGIKIIKMILWTFKNGNCQSNAESVLEGLGFVTNFKSELEKSQGQVL